jgi:plasmanylethanolamine desaturase
MAIIRIILEASLTIVVVDFISGLVHWMEDTFWTEKTPVVGRWIVRPNALHHQNATAFVRNSWLQSSWDLLLVGLMVLIVAWGIGVLGWQVWLFVFLGVNANQIHKWAHMSGHQVPGVIRMFQRLHLLQSPAHHARHHAQDKNSHYCVVTNLLNPILDYARFWRGLEKLLVPLFGAPRRKDLWRSNQRHETMQRARQSVEASHGIR